MELFRALVERPIFNLLEVIYALIPGHDLGVAIIVFTALIRFALWPLVKKQLHHTKKMRKLQPELKKIKKAANGDRQKLARLQMEFYKEHEIKPFSTIGTLLVQVPIFIGLYQAVNKLIKDPNTLQTFSYDWVRDLPWIKNLADNPDAFSHSLFGLVDLSQKGLMTGGGIYMGAIVLAGVAALAQYYQSKSLLVDQKDARKLKDILKAASSGEQPDQAEMTAAVSKGMLIFMPFITFIFSISIPSALSLYLLTSSVVGYFQQRKILKEDVEEINSFADSSDNTNQLNKNVADTPDSVAAEAQIVGEISGEVYKKIKSNKKTKSKKKPNSKKRRR